MDTESRKKALQYFFDKVVGPMGFKFTPDVELKDFLLEQEVMLESQARHPILPLPADAPRPRARHADRLPLHSLPPGTFRRYQTLLVRPVRAQGCHRPGQPAPTAAKGRGP